MDLIALVSCVHFSPRLVNDIKMSYLFLPQQAVVLTWKCCSVCLLSVSQLAVCLQCISLSLFLQYVFTFNVKSGLFIPNKYKSFSAVLKNRQQETALGCSQEQLHVGKRAHRSLGDICMVVSCMDFQSTCLISSVPTSGQNLDDTQVHMMPC